MTVAPSAVEPTKEPPSAELRGTLRDCTPQGKGLGKLGEGDIVFVDSPDMQRRLAEQIISHRPAAVVNLAPYSTGTLPTFGPHLLLDAGVPLFEAAGTEMRAKIRDGKKVTVSSTGQITVGRKVAGQAQPVSRSEVDATFAQAQRGLVENMEAYFGNTIEFIHSEAALLIDGVGAPELGDVMADRKVVVVSPAPDTRQRLTELKNFMQEYTPVVIGVGSAADTLADMGYAPDIIVGDPTDVAAENLRSDARVILPADPDGYAPGLERIQDLGVGAMTFPAATDSPTDLAILLATFHDAEMIVTVGQPVELDRIFADSATTAGTPVTEPAALLARLKAGRKIVDSSVITNLYAVESGAGVAWAWAILGVLVAAAVVILIAGLGGDGNFAGNLVDTWNTIVLTARDWFNGLGS
ncbi:thiamine pyrophosphokinase [Corynebacterium sp. zg912]|uniref:Thiamine pyrophosphokinase n=1 Tax=Corynebacterium wankanglinii TaxID=2735136 RepID=A0A7H0K878_9CORY|nr:MULTISPECIES: putative cytokinetic ring protein SteA [Corynebacterium]MBA1836872.1 thiamine pyrophosphokinase [Corynebacterium wankanglinii]MCR5927847.1 thiamine pyrophosphokinase [Corynebacterium sp. zg912]QNP93494.1 thiamine pyrophosphokinase [Corynebacterium wankanglinii]